MTLSSLYKEISAVLEKNSIEDGSLEARLILQYVLRFSYSEFLLRSNEDISGENLDRVYSMIERRVCGEPIQYILGEWDFMGYTFKVGEGVLIPRPETEILCEYVCDKIKDITSPVVYDLCSGSGCIGISIKKLCPDADIILVEKSDKALTYLRENCKNLCSGNMPTVIQGDILKPEGFAHLPKADVIVSNPPYIKSEEISALQREVLREPIMALDGGGDGLMFYRVLVNEWSKFLKDDGFMAFECGEDQSEDIKNLFSEIGFDSKAINDYNNIQRIVAGRRKTDVI